MRQGRLLLLMRALEHRLTLFSSLFFFSRLPTPPLLKRALVQRGTRARDSKPKLRAILRRERAINARFAFPRVPYENFILPFSYFLYPWTLFLKRRDEAFFISPAGSLGVLKNDISRSPFGGWSHHATTTCGRAVSNVANPTDKSFRFHRISSAFGRSNSPSPCGHRADDSSLLPLLPQRLTSSGRRRPSAFTFPLNPACQMSFRRRRF